MVVIGVVGAILSYGVMMAEPDDDGALGQFTQIQVGMDPEEVEAVMRAGPSRPDLQIERKYWECSVRRLYRGIR